jgi:hypothetical protein
MCKLSGSFFDESYGKTDGFHISRRFCSFLPAGQCWLGRLKKFFHFWNIFVSRELESICPDSFHWQAGYHPGLWKRRHSADDFKREMQNCDDCPWAEMINRIHSPGHSRSRMNLYALEIQNFFASFNCSGIFYDFNDSEKSPDAEHWPLLGRFANTDLPWIPF